MSTVLRGIEVGGEFSGVLLGDKRLNKRVQEVAAAMAANPAKSFPEMMGGDAELEGFYRLLGNERAEFDSLLKPHIERTRERIAAGSEIIVAQDTSDIIFPGTKRRKGLGEIGRGTQGFRGHFSLALSAQTLEPLGVVAVETISRKDKKKKKKGSKKNPTENESLRWGRGVDDSEAALAGLASAIYVRDREADIFLDFADFHEKKLRFVQRAKADRRLLVLDEQTDPKRLYDKVGEQVSLERLVPITRRKAPQSKKDVKAHPAREERQAKLHIAARQVTILRPQNESHSLPPSLTMNVVHVWEVDVPEAETPVEWWLYTSEPIDTPEQIARIVDIYRARWMIEEFFKALKTGCDYENRQLESYHTLLAALALFIPIAWGMLRLRHMERQTPEAPAASVLSGAEIAVLENLPPKKLKPNATIRDAFTIIAAWGGHQKQNGKPGWIILGRGYQKMVNSAAVWEVAHGEKM